MNDITYLFGAGASCQALPLVADFPYRFSVFERFVISKCRPKQDLISFIAEFKHRLEAHATFDTFFKKLFHQENTADSQVRAYKNILCLFFAFEQLIESHKLYDINQPEPIVQEVSPKRFNQDPRYDALIAGLLKPIKAKTEFYKNINFITWNYDVNLLVALKGFIAPKVNLGNYLQEHSSGGSYVGFGQQARVVHLNGIVYGQCLSSIDGAIDTNTFARIVYHFNPFDTNVFWEPHFSWEQNLDHFNNVSQMIEDSSDVIIIGYSFPLYNRLVDSKIFDIDNFKNKNVVVQDLNSAQVISTLTTSFSNFSEEQRMYSGIELDAINSCSSFHVPRNLMID